MKIGTANVNTITIFHSYVTPKRRTIYADLAVLSNVLKCRISHETTFFSQISRSVIKCHQ